MIRTIFAATMLAALAGCATLHEGAAVQTGDALARSLSGQRLVIPPPGESGLPDGMLLIAALRADGVADLSATVDGERTALFDDRQSWTVRGQELCIFDTPRPEDSDCIRVDWVAGNRIQLTDQRQNGGSGTSAGTLTPL